MKIFDSKTTIQLRDALSDIDMFTIMLNIKDD